MDFWLCRRSSVSTDLKARGQCWPLLEQQPLPRAGVCLILCLYAFFKISNLRRVINSNKLKGDYLINRVIKCYYERSSSRTWNTSKYSSRIWDARSEFNKNTFTRIVTKLVTMLRLHYDIPIIPPSVIENQNFFFFSGMTD